jgi:hypothetical protein
MKFMKDIKATAANQIDAVFISFNKPTRARSLRSADAAHEVNKSP